MTRLGDKMTKKIIIYTVLTIILTFHIQLKAEDTKVDDSILKNLEYPELVVTPLASQRLKQEAEQESHKKWLNLTAIQVSGLMTFYSGMQLDGNYNNELTVAEKIKDNKERVDNASQLAKTIGAAWFLGATALSAFYNPYSSGYEEIKNAPRKSKQQKLTRERIAEEKIETAGSLGRKLKYLSILTNLIANGFVLAEGQEDTRLVGALGALGAFAPLIFESQWEITADVHQEYKKKIYGPVSGLVPGSQGYIPTLGIAMSY